MILNLYAAPLSRVALSLLLRLKASPPSAPWLGRCVFAPPFPLPPPTPRNRSTHPLLLRGLLSVEALSAEPGVAADEGAGAGAAAAAAAAAVGAGAAVDFTAAFSDRSTSRLGVPVQEQDIIANRSAGIGRWAEGGWQLSGRWSAAPTTLRGDHKCGTRKCAALYHLLPLVLPHTCTPHFHLCAHSLGLLSPGPCWSSRRCKSDRTFP